MTPHKTVYVKLTNNCNLKCQHCYNSICTDYIQMTPETLHNVLLYIDDLREQGNTVSVALHGGEPMLYQNTDVLWDFVLACNEANIPITMTTNLVYRVTDEHIALFSLFKQADGQCLVLTSWDYKIRYTDKNQEDLWKKSVRKLIKHEIIVQPIISLTKILIENKSPKEIFDFMKSLGVQNLNFERITCTGRASENSESLIPTNAQVDAWLSDAYKIWQNSDDYDFYIPIFDSLEWAAHEGYFMGCRARECTKSVRTINPDGSVATCPNMPLEIIGNVNNLIEVYEYSDALLNNSKYKELCLKENLKNNECYTCEYYSICNGDCFQLRWDETGCPGLKKTINEVILHGKK